jgi:hypothetical protein
LISENERVRIRTFIRGHARRPRRRDQSRARQLNQSPSPAAGPGLARATVAPDEPSALASVTYTGPASLGPGPPLQIVIARYHVIAHPDFTGRLTIELTGAGTEWLVTSLR